MYTFWVRWKKLFEPFLFIGIAVYLTTVAEWQNNVLMNSDIRGWAGYLDTLIFNAVFLSVPAYVSFVVLRRFLRLPVVLLSQYLLWGFFGLMFEWFFIGHWPWSFAVQIGMFTYWAGVFTAPLMFLLPASRRLRVGASIYLVVGSVLMGGASLAIMQFTDNRDLVLLGVIVSWFFFYTGIIHFLLRQVGLCLLRREYLLLAVVVPVIEIISLQLSLVPVKLGVFVVAVVYVVWRVRRRYLGSGVE